MIEFEKTFIPKYLPKTVFDSPCKNIVDIYIPKSSDYPVLRIRQCADSFQITKKTISKNNDNSSHREETIHLSGEEFNELKGIRGNSICKKRYFFTDGVWNFEIDIFIGDLLGLILVDIEFESSEEMAEFAQYEWLLADVTQEADFLGGKLSGKCFSDIENKLVTYGYVNPMLGEL